jgi:hypothetical protein
MGWNVSLSHYLQVDYEINVTKKKVNDVQKEISAKKKVRMHDQLLAGFGSRYHRRKRVQKILLQRKKRSMRKSRQRKRRRKTFKP